MNQIAHLPNTELMPTDPAAVSAAETAKVKLQAAYQIANHYPRNLDTFRQNIIASCKRPKFAERALYSKPVGGKRITGPSVRFAEAALREWGHVRTETSVVYEDDFMRRILVSVTDFQSNAQFMKELTITKTIERRVADDKQILGERKNSQGQTVYILRATDEELMNKENAMISKAVRNEGLRVIPADIIEEAIEAIQATIDQEIKEDPDAYRKAVIDAFFLIGVKVADMELYLGHKIESSSSSELQELRNIYSSIKDGESSWADYMTLKNKANSDDENERKSATEALGALRKSKAKSKPKAEPKAEPKAKAEAEAEEPKAKAEEPKAKAKAKTKGELLSEVMSLLNDRKRDQIDLVNWAIRNKHITEAESIQEFSVNLLNKIIKSWDAVVI